MEAIEITLRQGMFYIKLNFLGGMETFADDENDIDVAISEAIECFIEISNKHGKGIKKELDIIFKNKILFI